MGKETALTDPSSLARERFTTVSAPPAVRGWLFLVWALIFAMVVVGGITRLTGSGLSIVEWQPVAGALPPLNEHAWQELFLKYQRSAQFHQVNSWMGLADFKHIFFWEYVHRLLGRVIGAVVVVPFLYFRLRGMLSRALAGKVLVVLALGGLQGFLGWYMVQSGLWQEPQVSHFRLAAHLLLAFVTGQCVLWLAVTSGGAYRPARNLGSLRRIAPVAAVTLLLLLAVQVVYGAFMAGTHAGYYFATFPDMNGHFLPGPFFSDTSLATAVTDPRAIHYLHRAFGYGILCIGIGLFVALRPARRALGVAPTLVAALTFIQFNLGAATVVRHVALPWAVLHQACAYLLVSAAVLLLERVLAAQPDIHPALSARSDDPPQEALAQ